MQTVEIVQIERSALEDLIYRLSKKAHLDALAEHQERDEMLNIAQICERTNMSRHAFAIFRDTHKIKCAVIYTSLGCLNLTS